MSRFNCGEDDWPRIAKDNPKSGSSACSGADAKQADKATPGFVVSDEAIAEIQEVARQRKREAAVSPRSGDGYFVVLPCKDAESAFRFKELLLGDVPQCFVVKANRQEMHNNKV